jgi:phosphoribosylformylglycinamidine synthase
MMACAIDEALRNYVSVGGNIEHVAGLDNFCWCDPVESERTPDGAYKAAQLVRANKALYEYCVAFGVPLISGKDSMKNDYQIGDTKISIPPTVLFSVIGKIDDVRKAVTMDVKTPGDLVYLLGSTADELGGSEYYRMCGELGANVPQVDAQKALNLYTTVNRAQAQGLLRSCHDLSDGGLAVSLAEKAFAGGCGIRADLDTAIVSAELSDAALLFSESQSRLAVTIKPENRLAFEALFSDCDCALIGEVTAEPILYLSRGGRQLIKSINDQNKEAWLAPLREL